jgi:HlyD family secretion protein
MKTGTMVVLLVVLIVGGAVGYWRWAPGVPVEAAQASMQPIHEFVDEQAQTRLPKIYQITMPYNGRIESIDLIEGTPVKAGQVVARVVPLDLDIDVASAQAAVDRLKASIREKVDRSVEDTNYEQALNFVQSMASTVKAAEERVKSGLAKRDFAEKTLHRVRSLNEKKAASDQELNQAEVNQVNATVEYQQDQLVLSAMRSLQAATLLLPKVVEQFIGRKDLSGAVLEQEKTQAEAHLRQVISNKARGIMACPIDGVVLERFENNERQVNAGTVLLTIGQLEDLETEADILSQDVVKVKLGDRVDLYGPAIGGSDQSAHGTVSRVFPAGFTKVSSLGVEQQRVKVIVQFEPGELPSLRTRGLGVGYRVRVRIYTAEKDKALVIPRSALFRGPRGDWQAFVVRQSAAQLQSLEIGLLNDEWAEVVKGLAEKDVVILAPETNLTQGARVTPIFPAETK